MEKQEVLRFIRTYGLIASPKDVAAAQILMNKWVRVFEKQDALITVEGAVSGIGGVKSVAACKEAIANGADFISSYGIDSELAAVCGKSDTLYIPSCSTATEVYSAIKLGCRVVKLFPASIETAKILTKRFPEVMLIPEGGIKTENIGMFACLENVAAVQPDCICPDCAEASVKALMGFELYHLGVNMPDAKAAEALAKKFEHAFGFEFGEGPFAWYSSRNLRQINEVLFDADMKPCVGGSGAFYQTADFEIMKSSSRGPNGHLGILVNDGARAVAYLTEKGYPMNDATLFYTQGRIFTVYMSDESGFGGFAVHLLQKDGGMQV